MNSDKKSSFTLLKLLPILRIPYTIRVGYVLPYSTLPSLFEQQYLFTCPLRMLAICFIDLLYELLSFRVSSPNASFMFIWLYIFVIFFQSRVSECQQRVNDLIDLRLCSDGVKTAIADEDYEQAAAHLHRFLSMDEGKKKTSIIINIFFRQWWEF